MSDNSIFETAWKFHTLGRCVIPSGGGSDGKAALIPWKQYQKTRPTDTQLQEWQANLTPTIWAMPTGAVSGLFVVDCDTPEANELMKAAGLKPHVKTAKGYHYYVAWPSWAVTNTAKLLPGIDIRGQGGYVNFCGNNGKASYEILIMPTDDTLIQIEKLPTEVQQTLKPKPKTMAERILQEALARAQPGNRNNTGLWLACQLRDSGLTQTEAENIMIRYATQVNNIGLEPYTEQEAIATLKQAYTRPAREPSYRTRSANERVMFALTDLGNAERLVSQFGDRLRYCYERKRWLVWTGKVWEWDWGNNVKALAKLTVRSIYQEAADEPDKEERKALVIHAKSSESNHQISAMISLAESEPGVPVEATELDTNPWLFNCLNGTIDLRTGQLLPHNKEDLLTIIAPVEYQPDAQRPRWLAFLDRVTNGNTELQGYLQRAVGYSLTGDTKSQVFFFLYGLGNNGKSTFTMTIRKLMGEYGGRVNTDLFMVKDKNIGGPKESLANLKGKRYVVASELEDGRRLAVSLIKDMTGGETIKADRKYEHEIEYLPTHKLWLVGNHKPVITDTSLAIWRRVKLIPFTVTIPNNEVDPDLPSKLEAELPGILSWAVKGCLDWQQHGLQEPKVITTATAHYRHEQDMLADFIEDCCKLEASASISKADLKSEYEKWCRDNNSEPVNQRAFRASV
jgi:putative DNA primase/helicase